MILALLGLTFVGSVLGVIYFSRGREVVVPKVVGKTQKEAQQIAQSSGLAIDIVEIVDEKSPANIILRQDPKSGMVVKRGYTIKVYLTREKN
jgi:beta-lactam-binding protein with PASTA domain